MKVVSVDNIIRTNQFYHFVKFMMLQQKKDTYFKGKFRMNIRSIPVKSVLFILKIYTKGFLMFSGGIEK